MIQLGFIEIDYTNGNKLKVTAMGNKILYGKSQAQLAKYVPPADTEQKGKRGSFKAQPIRPKQSESLDEQLWDALKQLRKQLAERESVPAYHIFSDASLEDMVQQKPVTLGDFNSIRGVGQIKLEKYGRVFVALIRFVLKLPKLTA